MTAGAWPDLSRARATAATTGVLPLPPAVILPTTITGQGGLWAAGRRREAVSPYTGSRTRSHRGAASRDRKSTRLNSSHVAISYAVFCLKKKKIKQWQTSYQR